MILSMYLKSVPNILNKDILATVKLHRLTTALFCLNNSTPASTEALLGASAGRLCWEPLLGAVVLSALM